MAERRDDFYIGYRPRAPKTVAARVRPAVIAALAIAAGVALLLLVAQSAFPPSVFEFGVVTEHVGVIRERPYPLLEVPRPGQGGARTFSTYYLSGFGKSGATQQVAGFDGQAVRLRGSLIYHEGRTMIEVESGSVQPLEVAEAAKVHAPSPVTETSLGTHTLTGEIVDSKCYLGVMKPGNLKPHRSCAVRCISGGVPPVLLVRDEQGQATYFLLVSADGRAVNREVLDLIAEPVAITGEVTRRGDLLVLSADPATYRRLGS